jgi:putative membrane protein
LYNKLKDGSTMLNYISNILKGALMGAANVIPGVSGGTMALLTGIFEKLIHTIKSFDLQAIKLAFTFKFKELFDHIDFKFLSAIGIGVVVSILSFAKILEYLFDHYALYVWAFFFGLILASVYYVGKKIVRIRGSVITLFIIGTLLAGSIAFMTPAEENASVPYLLICGAIAMCSMILPGLSGSYVLLLMGNYQLVMIKSISNFDLGVLIPVGIGAGCGLLVFARLLAWIFKKFHDQTIAVLTGFIFGSLSVLWPWKEAIIQTFEKGDGIKEKVIGYTYSFPEANGETAIALAIMVAGIAAIILVETFAQQKDKHLS